jgi:hypothetical protein
MDSSIYVGLGLQVLPQMVNVWINALSSWKIMKEISSQVCILSGQYSF